MHFMNPVPVMKLVEVIRGLQTSDDCHARTLELTEQLGKESATSLDRPSALHIGRIWCPTWLESELAN